VSESWLFWAVTAAGFAALTAVFAKIGVEGINSDLATFIRTIVVIFALAAFLTVSKRWESVTSVAPKTWIFLTLSGLATGASWLAYFRALQLGEASRVAPIDKLSIVLVAIFAALFLGERLPLTGWLGVGMIAGGAVLIAWR
jgi:transporter family protein